MYIEFKELEKYGFKAIQTTKDAGDMKNKLNLSKVLNLLNVNETQVVKGIQTHSTNILCIKKNTDISNIDGCDGYITNDKDYVLLAYFADCMPMFLVDKEKKTFSLLHGGWRGSTNKILENAIKIMVNEYNANRQDLVLVLGAHISVKNYEISEDLAKELSSKLDFDNIIEIRDSKYYLNLAQVNRNIALENGILDKNIILNNYCTYDGNFYSYRKDKTAKRNVAIIKVGE